MFCSSFGSFLIYLVVSPYGYNDDVHDAIKYFHGEDKTDTETTEKDFVKSG